MLALNLEKTDNRYKLDDIIGWEKATIRVERLTCVPTCRICFKGKSTIGLYIEVYRDFDDKGLLVYESFGDVIYENDNLEKPTTLARPKIVVIFALTGHEARLYMRKNNLNQNQAIYAYNREGIAGMRFSDCEIVRLKGYEKHPDNKEIEEYMRAMGMDDNKDANKT